MEIACKGRINAKGPILGTIMAIARTGRVEAEGPILRTIMENARTGGVNAEGPILGRSWRTPEWVMGSLLEWLDVRRTSEHGARGVGGGGDTCRRFRRCLRRRIFDQHVLALVSAGDHTL